MSGTLFAGIFLLTSDASVAFAEAGDNPQSSKTAAIATILDSLNRGSDAALAKDNYDPLPLAPDTTVAACDPQPSDDEKMLKALAFLISRRGEIRPAIKVDGAFTAMDGPPLTVEHPETALAAQPDCCWIAYDDRESPRAPDLRNRLGNNFGGFAYARIGDRVRSGQYAGQISNTWQSYSLNACGYPAFIMSDD